MRLICNVLSKFISVYCKSLCAKRFRVRVLFIYSSLVQWEFNSYIISLRVFLVNIKQILLYCYECYRIHVCWFCQTFIKIFVNAFQNYPTKLETQANMLAKFLGYCTWFHSFTYHNNIHYKVHSEILNIMQKKNLR